MAYQKIKKSDNDFGYYAKREIKVRLPGISKWKVKWNYGYGVKDYELSIGNGTYKFNLYVAEPISPKTIKFVAKKGKNRMYKLYISYAPANKSTNYEKYGTLTEMRKFAQEEYNKIINFRKNHTIDETWKYISQSSKV